MLSKTSLLITLFFFFSFNKLVMSQEIPTWTFKEKKVELSETKLKENVIIRGSAINEYYKDAFLPHGQRKMGNASIESLIWSPNSVYLSFGISQLFSGDTDAIWCINATNKKYYPVTKEYYWDSDWFPVFHSPYNAWTYDNKLYIRVQHYKHSRSLDSYWARFFFNPADSSYENMTNSVNNHTLPDTLPSYRRISSADYTIIDSLTISTRLLNNLERYTFEGFEISPNGKFIVAEQPTYHNEPGPLFIIKLRDNTVYETNLIVQKFDMWTAEIQRWDDSGNIYCESIYGVLHFINLESKTDYSLSSINYNLKGCIFSPNQKYLAVLFDNKKTGEDFLSVLTVEMISFLK